jgi:FkbM family methyltransferase
MIVNTRRLFIRLLRVMHIDTVCDVGSMDGAEALQFRAAAPEAAIYAFEAHPENFGRMQADPELRRKAIVVSPLAVTDYDGEAQFFATNPEYSPAWRGMSSLHRRFARPQLLTALPVTTTRLDSFLADKVRSDARLALWVDAEGKAYEVISGVRGVIRSVHVLHLEVETVKCIGEEQMVYREVEALLRSAGFHEIATDAPPDRTQFNALFVRDDLPQDTYRRISRCLARARLRYLVVSSLCRLCPACARWYSSLRARAAKRH